MGGAEGDRRSLVIPTPSSLWLIPSTTVVAGAIVASASVFWLGVASEAGWWCVVAAAAEIGGGNEACGSHCDGLYELG